MALASSLQLLSSQLTELRAAIARADRGFDVYMEAPADDDAAAAGAAWLIETVFLKLLVLAEHLSLPGLRSQILEDAAAARTEDHPFVRFRTHDGEPYSVWIARARQLLGGLEVLAGPKDHEVVTMAVEDVLRACVYPITDPLLFGTTPSSEEQVHRRIEGILRCVFPDLRHKPSLAKPIKNFIPDTGLPSVRTLIEYKFVSSLAQVKLVADEILADSRGYHSAEYDRFVFVIYETTRLKPEAEWRALLTDCGIAHDASVIVLSGTPASPSQVSAGSASAV